MNQITKLPITSIGYNFIPKEYIPKGKDEYYLRNKQHRNKIKHRQLTAVEIKALIANHNTSDNWKNIWVEPTFNPSLVKGCTFYGFIRIGKLEQLTLEFHNLRLPVGLYNSTIVSTDIGSNVVVNNVNMISHYIIGDEVILVNINEMATTNHAKFGNGVVKQGETESVRTWMEVCNENGGRSILPFNGMQAADAWMWSKYRDDEALLEKFKQFTDKQFDTKRGYYSKIGDRTVIKNSRILKDVWIGSDAYIKGANKIKNITINSSAQAKSQIGEGCELVNGIIGFGCRIFYGVKAVRFVMGNSSQLKYGARLINSYLGDNSTISCCEVLNSLIFPGHEQHHNNSFLCAAVIMGQSNVAAGATIGSNHNSRGADGEIIAGRGFWPGLCVSLKHNSQFASFTIIAKGDFPAELNIPIPFSLVSNDVANDRLVVMPAYWFLYNLYALSRNESKYTARDKRIDKSIKYEYDVFGPDSMSEIVTAIKIMAIATAKAWVKAGKQKIAEHNLEKEGLYLLENMPDEIDQLVITVDGFENSKRKVVLIKVAAAYSIFQRLKRYYVAQSLLGLIEHKKIKNWAQLFKQINISEKPTHWVNVGGQLVTQKALNQLIEKIKKNSINSWDEVHTFYKKQSDSYAIDKMRCGISILGVSASTFTKKYIKALFMDAISTREWISEGIFASRARDFENPFRKMVYSSQKEMESVLGTLKENNFINLQKKELAAFKQNIVQGLEILRNK
ncbi:MAG: hypothetical protein RIR12_2583 [Bacteroidota bacterium]|jgi:NDP-sugar pyrophosphorylase family protein